MSLVNIQERLQQVKDDAILVANTAHDVEKIKSQFQYVINELDKINEKNKNLDEAQNKLLSELKSELKNLDTKVDIKLESIEKKIVVEFEKIKANVVNIDDFKKNIEEIAVCVLDVSKVVTENRVLHHNRLKELEKKLNPEDVLDRDILIQAKEEQHVDPVIPPLPLKQENKKLLLPKFSKSPPPPPVSAKVPMTPKNK